MFICVYTYTRICSRSHFGSSLFGAPDAKQSFCGMLLGIRHRGKQPQKVAPSLYGNPVTDAIASAIRAEGLAADGLLGLHVDRRVANAHHTHARTNNKKDVQPHQLTRKQFWQHLCRCFQLAYPRAASTTGSILEFGLVGKERHKDAPRQEDRSEHHHCATHASEIYRWKIIRQISAERYNIQLNAVAHDTYTTMFCYLRCPTVKKPVHELDVDPFFSPGHPQGENLRLLLSRGEKYKRVRAAIGTSASSSTTVPVRSQFGIVFNWVTEHNLRKRKGAAQLEADAVTELKAGRPQLLDFCKKHKACLQDQLDYIWSLSGAEEKLQRLDKSRLDILAEAASLELSFQRLAEKCCNGTGECEKIYEAILEHHCVGSPYFRHELYETLAFGRRKGNAFMIVGGKDTGKTTVTQPAEMIFETMKCPQSDSFCPLEGIRGHELLLWQDFRYNPGHPKADEKGLRLDIGTWNRLLEGLPTPIGVPKSDGSRVDFVYDEDAPLIATGPFQPTGYKDGVANEKETEQLTCRCKFVHFRHPAPQNLDRTVKACPMCWSRWVLLGELAWRRHFGQDLDDFLTKVAAVLVGPPAPPSTAPMVSPPATPFDPVPSAAEFEPEADEEAEELLRDMDGLKMPSVILPEVPPVPGMNCPGQAPSVGIVVPDSVEATAEWEEAASEALRIVAAARPACQAAPPTSATNPDVCGHLANIMAWRRAGLLSQSEFANAKRQLGL